MHRRAVLALITTGLAAACPGAAAADAWPAQTVKFITSGPPGSAPDLMARLFADRLAKKWKRTVVVENIPGAGGALAAKTFKRAEDNHTLLLAPSGVVMVAPVLQSKLPYDPDKDLLPIAAVTTDFLAIVASTSIEAVSMKDFVLLARSKPGTLNWYASPGAPYLTFLNLTKRADLNMTYVPYRGASGSTMADLATGTLQAALVPLTAVRGLAADGKVRLLAVTNRERASAFPTVPTVAEAGYPELEMEGVLGAFGWKGMPSDLAKRIAEDFRDAGRDRELVSRFAAAGQVVRVTGPADYKAYLAKQREKWTSVAKTFDVKPR
jgi:tripartite-type tricarboxylate transporter receptor subunit TctC